MMIPLVMLLILLGVILGPGLLGNVLLVDGAFVSLPFIILLVGMVLVLRHLYRRHERTKQGLHQDHHERT